MEKKYTNFVKYVNALGKRGEVSTMTCSLIAYAGLTWFFMLMICLPVFLEQSLYMVIPITFTILVVIFFVWYIKLKKKINKFPNKVLLYNGVVSLATASMFLRIG